MYYIMCIYNVVYSNANVLYIFIALYFFYTLYYIIHYICMCIYICPLRLSIFMEHSNELQL